MALILASTSSIRSQMLADAGVEHVAMPPAIDEAPAKERGLIGEDLAYELARAKAVAVSLQRPDEWVIGSDSTISVDGRAFDKPASRGEAAEHLRFFSGRTIELSSAVALARGGPVDWDHGETARLHVRDLSDAFIESYLDTEWPQVGNCVGVFRMEGPGVQLFERVEGSHFTILGMPLIPLLGALREREVLPR